MGIKNLAKLLGDHAAESFKRQQFDNYFGRKIAVDASMHIYQFLVVVGRTGDQMLTNESGEVTSHLQGMFYRTARMLEAGMKPVYVFDGKPPEGKKEELARRLGRRGEATEALEQAKERGDSVEDIEKYSKRTVKVTRQHNEECQRLLQLMGIPIIIAPSEAEAQCASMCKEDLVYAMSSEDMDSLTFATPRLVRNLMKPASQAVDIIEYDYEKVLSGLGISAAQFVDLCILCGCDYCGTIKGIGGVTALKLVQKHKNLEGVLASLDPAKYDIPDPFPYATARELFTAPEVLSGEAVPPLKWGAPDEQGIVDFLVGEKSFNEARIRATVTKINAAKNKSAQVGRAAAAQGGSSPSSAPSPSSTPRAARSARSPRRRVGRPPKKPVGAAAAAAGGGDGAPSSAAAEAPSGGTPGGTPRGLERKGAAAAAGGGKHPPSDSMGSPGGQRPGAGNASRSEEVGAAGAAVPKEGKGAAAEEAAVGSGNGLGAAVSQEGSTGPSVAVRRGRGRPRKQPASPAAVLPGAAPLGLGKSAVRRPVQAPLTRAPPPHHAQRAVGRPLLPVLV